MIELETLKKKIIYRSNYRGTKEMDILLSKFVDKYINTFSKNELEDLFDFLNLEDEIIYNYYQTIFYNYLQLLSPPASDWPVDRIVKVHFLGLQPNLPLLSLYSVEFSWLWHRIKHFAERLHASAECFR